MKDLRIAVTDTAGLGALRPVTGGVPIAEGAAPEGTAFALHDEQGNAIPLQTSVLARWKDGSARWVLLDFQSQPPAHGTLGYVVSWGDEAAPAEPKAPVQHEGGERPVLRSGDVAVSLADEALLGISDRLDVLVSLTDAAGETCNAVAESAEVETAGPLRSTLALRGAFRKGSGERVFQFRLRASVYAGLSAVRLEPLIVVDADKGIVQRIRELQMTFRPRTMSQRARLGGEPGWEGSATAAGQLLQHDDEHYALNGERDAGGHAPGWAEVEDGQGTLAIALRDFWQQWPKSLETSFDGLTLGLFPRFEEGAFAHMEPWYKHQYLFDGDCYQLRTGQARRWDIWLGLQGDGAALARMADAPLAPAADPAQAIATGVWDDIAPAGTPEMADYDPWAENLFAAYCHSIESQHDYGVMNWGDWFGERHVNWGNHEYDTTNQLLIQFARTADPRYFHVADAAARHSSEVDTVHHVNAELARYFDDNFGHPTYPPRPGMVHQHAVGHVGCFYPIDTVRELLVEHGVGSGTTTPYTCLDPFNLGHVWTQGLVRHYFLTGDPFLRETVGKIGANLAQLVEDREYQFVGHSHCGRTTGWSMLALAGAYELGLDDRYLNAMRTLADDALGEQDPNCGGWIYSLPHGHCFCEKAKHVGMATFITSVLIDGLSRYHLLAGDERIPHAIDRAVTYMNHDTWREAQRGWRYTSCPAHHAASQPGVVVMAYVNAVRITHNPEHLRVLRLAWDAKFQRLLEAPPAGPGHGKTYTATMYGCAEAIGLLAAAGQGDD